MGASSSSGWNTGPIARGRSTEGGDIACGTESAFGMKVTRRDLLAVTTVQVVVVVIPAVLMCHKWLARIFQGAHGVKAKMMNELNNRESETVNLKM